MDIKNNRGPAFPSHGSMGEVVQTGMSLRDYFAIHATDGDVLAMLVHSHPMKRQEDRYKFSDEMLKARGNNDL